MREQKQCSVCGGPTYAEYGICRRSAECQRAYYRDHMKRNWQKYMHGLSPEDYQKLWDSQDGKCAICDKVLTEANARTDHDHTTNTVRGLLCHRCNIGMGYFDDDAELIMRVIAYLENQ